MAPNGERYFREWYKPDFSTQPADYQHLFIHKMLHVWQREQGMWVKTRGMFSWAANYSYKLDFRFLKQYAHTLKWFP